MVLSGCCSCEETGIDSKNVAEKTSFTSLLRKWDKIRKLREAVAKKVAI